MLRQQVAQFTKRQFREGRLRSSLEMIIRAATRLNPSLKGAFQTDPSVLGAVVPVNVEDAELIALLDSIPTETTQQERRYLYRFFSTTWEGAEDVLEIGPFLGGTTRAIALGMQDNVRRTPGRKLFTFDRFSRYWKPVDLLEVLRPLFDAGILGGAERHAIEENGSFKESFDKLHSGHRYTSLLVAQDRPVPDTRAQEQSLPNLFRLDDELQLGAVFVDGCKSWYGTRYFMTHVCQHTRPGAYFLFQDYGWYTCFWLPAFLELMGNRFHLVSYVDSTYTFQQRACIDAATIARIFPETPDGLPTEALCGLFDRLIARARDRADQRGELSLSLQRAAALAYVGRKDEARAAIANLAVKERPPELARWVQQASRIPTYTPDGDVEL